MGPYCQPLHLHRSSDGCCLLTMLTTHAESTNAVDKGEAYEGNDPEPAKPQQRMPTLREYER